MTGRGWQRRRHIRTAPANHVWHRRVFCSGAGMAPSHNSPPSPVNPRRRLGPSAVRGLPRLGAAFHGNSPPQSSGFSAQREVSPQIEHGPRGPCLSLLKILHKFDCFGAASVTAGDSHRQPSVGRVTVRGEYSTFEPSTCRRACSARHPEQTRWAFTMDHRWAAMQQNPGSCSGNAANLRRCSVRWHALPSKAISSPGSSLD
jgi:hypothetical protein